MVRIGSCMVVLSALAVTSHARAESAGGAPPERNPPLVELGAVGFARYDFGTFCEQDLDVVSCTTGRVFAGVAVVPRIRLSPLVSVGALGAFGWKVGSEGTASGDGSRTERTLTTYRLEAEARVHPLDDSRDIDFWLGLDLGVSALRDAWQSYDPSGEQVGSTANTDVGPVLGAGLGVDFRIASFVALGPEVRAAAVSYDEFEGFVSLGVAGTFLVDP